ncbi:hypothetical protein ACFQ6O_40600 [Streptomyces sp. NPDC056441]|uniref:hypothetical protein n=1 Tax=Streptomyces sp. NPDC056441 TaxID=3345817 RepID=UPI0036AD6722
MTEPLLPKVREHVVRRLAGTQQHGHHEGLHLALARLHPQRPPHRVAHLAQFWNGGDDWHTGGANVVRPEQCATAAEWAQRLVPVARDQAPTVLEQELLSNARNTATDELLHDPVTGVPAIRRTKRWPNDRPEDIFTFALQRLPTTSPLAALIVSGNTTWIRTGDNTLWFAPATTGYGVSWGYDGSGN